MRTLISNLDLFKCHALPLRETRELLKGRNQLKKTGKQVATMPPIPMPHLGVAYASYAHLGVSSHDTFMKI